ncbi:MAG: aminotransferase class V-fold PLP-dependent enzyme [Erysipelotrichaceae bacterium]|jgi:cysteine desulfurase|nr:aminotransferase class V-fold PLP-dependent enzyme [Erysipelotrichaceae bacterium]
MIYLDYASTSLLRPEVLEAYERLLKGCIGNPSNSNHLGLELEDKLNKARKEILKLLGLNNHHVTFTSGATEANNLAIFGFARRNKKRGNVIITSRIEHSSITNPIKVLTEEGFVMKCFETKDYGYDYDSLFRLLSDDVLLLSLTEVNNETGLIFDYEMIRKIKQLYPHLIIHLDITQAIGHLEPHSYQDCDFLTFSLHKLGGPTGSGILIKRNRLQLQPLIYGGGQEDEMRSGTINTVAHLLYPFAIKLMFDDYQRDSNELLKELDKKLKDSEEIVINTKLSNSANHILNFSLRHKKSSILFEALNQEAIYLSTKSSCASRHQLRSNVVYELTKNEIFASNSLRVSLGHATTKTDIDSFTKALKRLLETIKE